MDEMEQGLYDRAATVGWRLMEQDGAPYLRGEPAKGTKGAITIGLPDGTARSLTMDDVRMLIEAREEELNS